VGCVRVPRDTRGQAGECRSLKKEKLAPGLVDIVEHKKPLNPNEAISMPGVPAEASPHLLKAMKKQDKLLAKIFKMETWESTHDPLHKKTRKKWLQLAGTINHMSPGPEKMKSQVALLKLAKQLADKEKKEQTQAKKIATSKPAAASKKVSKATVKKLLNSIIGQSASAAAAAPEPKTINGLPVSKRHCFEQACISKLPNGECVYAVIKCGGADGKEPKQTKLSKKAAIANAMAGMKKLLPLMKIAGAKKN